MTVVSCKEHRLLIEDNWYYKKKFGSVSGTKLNLSKTECILLGKLKNMLRKEHFKQNINRTSVNCLGIHTGHNNKKCNEKIVYGNKHNF